MTMASQVNSALEKVRRLNFSLTEPEIRALAAEVRRLRLENRNLLQAASTPLEGLSKQDTETIASLREAGAQEAATRSTELDHLEQDRQDAETQRKES